MIVRVRRPRTLGAVKPTVLAGRLAYRTAHRILRVWWLLTKPENDGVKCVITDGAQVLLVQHTYGRREWDLPGGGLKRNEAAIDAARREIEEELGVRIEDWQSIGSAKASAYHSRDTLHCFLAELHDPQLTIDEIEIDAARWFPRAQLPRTISKHAKAVLALLDGEDQGTLEQSASATTAHESSPSQ
jgi:8-oxo-dGTP pyrophosphatase MutT (NUDIX family)